MAIGVITQIIIIIIKDLKMCFAWLKYASLPNISDFYLSMKQILHEQLFLSLCSYLLSRLSFSTMNSSAYSKRAFSIRHSNSSLWKFSYSFKIGIFLVRLNLSFIIELCFIYSMLKFYISSFLNYTLTGLTLSKDTDYLRRSHDSFALIAFTFLVTFYESK